MSTPSAVTAWLTRAAPATRWRALLRRFDQCSQRERQLLIAAGCALALMAADALWLGPALAAFKTARGQQQAATTALSTLQTDVRQLQDQGSALAREQQAELATWRQRVRDGDATLNSQQDLLVGPDRMVGLLEHLLARHGELRVRALRSLGRADLLAAATANAAAAPGAAASATTATEAATPTLYRHGVELVIEGGFAELMAYLRAVEALPQRVLWGSVSLKVEQHPKSVLTLRVYTLSRERHWLEI